MAISSTSLEASCFAPTNFKLSSSFDSNDGAISVAVEHCQLCGGSKRPFYCEKCVTIGDFVRSKCDQPTRYADKLLKWHNLKKERSRYLKSLQEEIPIKEELQQREASIATYQDRISYLQEIVNSAKSQLYKERNDLQKMQEINQKRHSRMGIYGAKKKKIAEYIDRMQCNIESQQVNLSQCEPDMQSRKAHISDLIKYIFPVSEVQPRSDVDVMAMSTVSALAEARHTSYVRGRWIYTDNGGEHQYQIVDPTLPGNGDYSSYIICLTENKESGPDAELGQKNPAYTISAALSLTTQFITLIAYFLNVNLPKRLCYSEFCGPDLTEKDFNRAVFKLNHNVLHLCFTQNVNPELLHARHTIHNILTLLKTPELGRCGVFTITPELMQSMDASPSGTPADADLESSEDEIEPAEGGEQEWERVPVSLPEAEVPPHPSYFTSTQVQSRPSSKLEGTTSITGTLFSSTAASISSVASLLWGRPKENK